MLIPCYRDEEKAKDISNDYAVMMNNMLEVLNDSESNSEPSSTSTDDANDTNSQHEEDENNSDIRFLLSAL